MKRHAVTWLVDKHIEFHGTIPLSFYSSVLDSLAGKSQNIH
jgi:hypothetical protein